MTRADEAHELMTGPEVARLFRVDPKTVARWHKEGRLKSHLRTPGGHHRYRRSEVLALLTQGATDDLQQ